MAANGSPILVTGATGFVAGQLVPRLLERGHAVRVMARRPERLGSKPWSRSVEVVAADVLAPQTLGAALQGVHTAYYLIHGMTSGRGYVQRDIEAAGNFAKAAADAGVRHIVYLGALADPGAGLAGHLRSRMDTGAALRLGPVPVTELRAGVIVGAEGPSFRMLRRITELLPFIPGHRWMSHKAQPIAVRNAVDYLLAALDEPPQHSRSVEIGGADVSTYAELLQRYARVRGLRRRIVPMPDLPVWLMALGAALLTPTPYSLARAVVGGLANDSMVCHDDASRIFPTVRVLDFDAAAREALAQARTRDDPARAPFRLGRFAMQGTH